MELVSLRLFKCVPYSLTTTLQSFLKHAIPYLMKLRMPSCFSLSTYDFFSIWFSASSQAASISPFSAYSVTATSQQQKTLKGTVNDAFGPLVGVSVVVKGTTNGVVTDLDGNFTLNVNEGDILQISFIGYATQEIKYTGQPSLTVKLQEDTQLLEEVVVVGYGTQKKVNMTGSVAQVDSKMLESRPIQNLSTGIQGLMPGVTVVTGSGLPGQDGGTIRVRGVGTLNSADPYILVDGLETGTLNSVDPNDIESISVLKDAASAAIYGSKASNGVILITTKRGKSGKPRINYNGYVSIQNPTMLQDLMSSYDYARLYDKARVEYGLEPRFDKVGDGKIYEKFRDGSDPYNYPNTDWYDLAYRTGFQHNHNVNVSGGTDNLKYMASVGYFARTSATHRPAVSASASRARTARCIWPTRSTTPALHPRVCSSPSLKTTSRRTAPSPSRSASSRIWAARKFWFRSTDSRE